MKVKIKKEIDKEILRSFGLFEVIEKTEKVDGKEDKKYHEEKYPEVGADVEIPEETLWRFGVYDNKSFVERLGELFQNDKAEKEVAASAMAEQKEGEKIESKTKSKSKGGE